MFFKKKYLPEADLLLIKQAIQAAEKQTSGEIRVYIEASTHGHEVLSRAANRFVKLKMEKTKLRNGVLIYLAMKDKQFAVAGDVNIHQHVKEEFWKQVAATIQPHFAQQQITQGICKAVELAGIELKKYFPYKTNDTNEQADDVVMG
jgi:uncharacterized membrane protein